MPSQYAPPPPAEEELQTNNLCRGLGSFFLARASRNLKNTVDRTLDYQQSHKPKSQYKNLQAHTPTLSIHLSLPYQPPDLAPETRYKRSIFLNATCSGQHHHSVSPKGIAHPIPTLLYLYMNPGEPVGKYAKATGCMLLVCVVDGWVIQVVSMRSRRAPGYVLGGLEREGGVRGLGR